MAVCYVIFSPRNSSSVQIIWKMRVRIDDQFSMRIVEKSFFRQGQYVSPSFSFFINPNFSPSLSLSLSLSSSLCYSPLHCAPRPACVRCVRRRRQPQQFETYGRSYVGKKERRKKSKKNDKTADYPLQSVSEKGHP